MGKGGGKGDDDEVVDAGGLEATDFFLLSGEEEPRRVCWGEGDARVGFEGDCHGWLASILSAVYEPMHEGLVATMDAVKSSYSDNGASGDCDIAK